MLNRIKWTEDKKHKKDEGDVSSFLCLTSVLFLTLRICVITNDDDSYTFLNCTSAMGGCWWSCFPYGLLLGVLGVTVLSVCRRCMGRVEKAAIHTK